MFFAVPRGILRQPATTVAVGNFARPQQLLREAIMGLRLFDPNYYHEISQRTNQGRFVIDPNNVELRHAFYGVLACAAWTYDIKVLAFHFMTNHYHGLYEIQCPRQFSMFLAYLHAGFARAYHRLHGTNDKFWGYMTWNPVAKDEASVRQRLKYIMGQATAAGIVQHPDEFQGASSLDWMLHGKSLDGVMFNATQKCRDSRRLAAGARPDEAYITRHTLAVVAPAVWADLSPEQLRERYWQIADEVAGVGRVQSGRDQRQRPDLPVGAGEPQTSAAASAFGAAEQNIADLQCVLPRDWTESSEQLPSRQRHEKSQAPMPTGEDGEVLCTGPVKPKLRGGQVGRARRPKLLAADRATVQAYEDGYAQACEAYREAKETWRNLAQFNDHALLSVEIALPPYMLLGTLPLRLPGDKPRPRPE